MMQYHICHTGPPPLPPKRRDVLDRDAAMDMPDLPRMEKEGDYEITSYEAGTKNTIL